MKTLPEHLNPFIVRQEDRPYSPRDHAVWRFILRQLKSFLSKNAHPFYIQGLEKTGITVESIPSIEHISRHLSQFHWQAKPVSGFIPPAAFMELQALSILPIASDMRSIDQLMYTPAPDIVHEAAGHAPMLAHPEYAQYLRDYAEVAKNAIISKKDLFVYEAIRILSDLKSDSSTSKEQIENANRNLEKAVKENTEVSEATLLSRMNWWTAEYGLIGTLQDPKIYGAGLLSSVGEARWCLSEKVKKIPFSLKCIDYSYDITEPQPQLFVTPDFRTLSKVLDELSRKMAYRTGGPEALTKALHAQTVNSVVLNTGLQISSQVSQFLQNEKGEIIFLKFEGPAQLAFEDQELPGHSTKYHSTGFSTPMGSLKAFPHKCPSSLTINEWKQIGVEFQPGSEIILEFSSGFQVQGRLKSTLLKREKLLILSLDNAVVEYQGQRYFEPAWGTFDMALATHVNSVFGGPADRKSFGLVDPFVVAKVPAPKYSRHDLRLFAYYQILRDLREGKKPIDDFEPTVKSFQKEFPDEWLLHLEALEISLHLKRTALSETITSHLHNLTSRLPAGVNLHDGLKLADQLFI